MPGKTALVVEDDQGIASFLKDALEHEGFEVSWEKDGEQALRALSRRLPSILVTDMLMPGLGGVELIEAARRMPDGESLPIICMSGIYKTERHKRNALERLKVAAYLDKPFEMAALIDAVNGCVGVRRPAVTDALRDVDAQLDAIDKKPDNDFTGPRRMKGNLKKRPFAELLASLHQRRSSGALLVRREGVKKIVYLKSGVPVFVRSNVMAECLGRILVREKMISEDDCTRSLEKLNAERSARKARRQGEILIEMGSMSPQNLVYALQLQLEQKLTDLFGWPDGDYQLNENLELPEQIVQLDVSVSDMIKDGVKRRFTEELVDLALEHSLGEHVAPHPSSAQHIAGLTLDDAERKLFAMVDGRRTLADVVARSGMDALAGKRLAYVLIILEIIKTIAQPSTQPPKLPKK